MLFQKASSAKSEFDKAQPISKIAPYKKESRRDPTYYSSALAAAVSGEAVGWGEASVSE
jgi:hypothetical protein